MDKVKLFDPAGCCRTGDHGPGLEPGSVQLVAGRASLPGNRLQRLTVTRINHPGKPTNHTGTGHHFAGSA